MLAQAHGYPGITPAGRSPMVLHPNASHGLPPPYGGSLAVARGLGSGVRDFDTGNRYSSSEGRLPALVAWDAAMFQNASRSRWSLRAE
jgi:hypothetical protein